MASQPLASGGLRFDDFELDVRALVLGSGTITQRAFAEKIFAASGRPPKFLIANKLMLRAFGLFNPLMREMVEMHYLQTEPVLMDDSRLGELLGGIRRTSYSYDDGIRETLAAMPSPEES